MRYRTLPRCDVTVSEVGLGVWTLTAGWWGTYTEGEAVSLLHQAYDLGVTFYDTGVRASELLGAEAEDIDFDAGVSPTRLSCRDES